MNGWIVTISGDTDTLPNLNQVVDYLKSLGITVTEIDTTRNHLIY